MGTGYQEDKKEHYEKIMSEITGHPDFGKKNPVDIGIDCGYSEETVMEMIQFLYDFKDQPKTGVRNRDDREKYYFLMQREIGGILEYDIVSVNINTWEVEPIKKAKYSNLFQLKGNIYAHVDNMYDKYVIWENLENGKKGKFRADSAIEDVLIMEDGIAAMTGKSIIMFPFQGEQICIKCDFIGYAKKLKMIEGRDAFYVISVDGDHSKIWKVEKDRPYWKVIFNYRGLEIVLAECEDNELIWYVEDSIGWGRNKYSERNLPGFEEGLNEDIGQEYGCIEGISTKNYELLYRTIYRKEDRKEICKFDRYMRYGNQVTDRHVVGIYEKDIFVGVGMGGKDIIKIDLRDEKEPIILPVYKK